MDRLGDHTMCDQSPIVIRDRHHKKKHCLDSSILIDDSMYSSRTQKCPQEPISEISKISLRTLFSIFYPETHLGSDFSNFSIVSFFFRLRAHFSIFGGSQGGCIEILRGATSRASVSSVQQQGGFAETRQQGLLASERYLTVSVRSTSLSDCLRRANMAWSRLVNDRDCYKLDGYVCL